MKKTILLVAAFAITLFTNVPTHAQTGTVSTVAGCNMCILTPVDGVTATLAEFFESAGIALDASRNVYIADKGVHKVRRILASSNLVYTVAGDGTAGFAGDGMVASATGVQLNKPNGIFIDGSNNLFIADEGNGRVRKVDAVTGIINTIAGGGVSTADGVPATTASLTPRCVYVDGAGNIYTSGGNKLKKIDGTTGIITSIAGNGIAADAGDGGPATAASIAGPIKHITMDAAGNIYIVSDSAKSLRRIDAITGIITTIIGSGYCPAGSISSCGIDVAGNVIIIDRRNKLMRRWDPSKNITHTIGGGGSAVAEYAPALTAYMNGYSMWMDNSGGNIYITDSSHWIRKMSYSHLLYVGYKYDSFSTTINKLCSGPKLTVNTFSYSAGLTIKTWFGDGQTNTAAISSDCSGKYGVAEITHVYANSGTYTIKQVMYSGATAIDSMHRTYQHTLCNGVYLKNYYDVNNNCTKDAADGNISLPILVEIDSNGIKLDTMSFTSGFYYTAYGNTGDVYSFKPVSMPAGLMATCPSSGIIYDTLKPLVYNDTNFIGYTCSPGTPFDLSIRPVIPVTGIRDQWGNIYVSNLYCNGGSTTASVTLYFSPKYKFTGDAHPAASSSTSNSITWNSIVVSANDPRPVNLYYAIWRNLPGGPLAGDTVQTHVSISPVSGDANPTDNAIVVIDTVRASCDPNAISVVPNNGCLYSGNKLTYTIQFENTGNDTAFNIYVLDTMSDNLNLETMRVIMASHSMDVSLIHSGGYNILKFDFPDIDLLDSSHHGLCNGAFVYSIDAKNSLPDGTQIPNRVGIYFDYNPVVLTNTVVNTIGCPTGVPEIAGKNNVALFPNPATNTLTIKMDDGAYSSCTISNTLGQSVMQQQLNSTQTNIAISSLPPGMYYVTLYGEHENKVLKFVKQ
jgi:uncharacterized repeat protein (TIGR01451 family)